MKSKNLLFIIVIQLKLFPRYIAKWSINPKFEFSKIILAFRGYFCEICFHIFLVTYPVVKMLVIFQRFNWKFWNFRFYVSYDFKYIQTYSLTLQNFEKNYFGGLEWTFHHLRNSTAEYSLEVLRPKFPHFFPIMWPWKNTKIVVVHKQ